MSNNNFTSSQNLLPSSKISFFFLFVCLKMEFGRFFQKYIMDGSISLEWAVLPDNLTFIYDVYNHSIYNTSNRCRTFGHSNNSASLVPSNDVYHQFYSSANEMELSRPFLPCNNNLSNPVNINDSVNNDCDYSNLVRESNESNRQAVMKGPWTAMEDEQLVHWVNIWGEKEWSCIGGMLRSRSGKQCRERWYNHVRPGIKKGAWSVEEERVLIRAQSELGSRWTEIAKRLPGRTESSVKNRWNSNKRRCSRRGSSSPAIPEERSDNETMLGHGSSFSAAIPEERPDHVASSSSSGIDCPGASSSQTNASVFSNTFTFGSSSGWENF